MTYITDIVSASLDLDMATRTTLPSPLSAIAHIDEQLSKTWKLIQGMDRFRDEVKIAGLKTIIDSFLDQRLVQMAKRDGTSLLTDRAATLKPS